MTVDFNLIADRVKAMGGVDKAADQLGKVFEKDAAQAKRATLEKLEQISDKVQAQGGVDAFVDATKDDTDKARAALRALFLGF